MTPVSQNYDIQSQTKNSKPIIALFIANAISLTGNIFSSIAIPWLVLQTTGSATQTGITGFFTILPIVLAGFFGGALIDRLGFKRTSILADLASGITVLFIPLNSPHHWITFLAIDDPGFLRCAFRCTWKHFTGCFAT